MMQFAISALEQRRSDRISRIIGTDQHDGASIIEETAGNQSPRLGARSSELIRAERAENVVQQ